MCDPEALRRAIFERLSRVIDPETGVDVVRMRLIEDLTIDEGGQVTYKFRPSSPFCPIVLPLSMAIKQAIDEVEGVARQNMEIVGYVQAEEFTAMFQEWMANEEKQNQDPT